MTMTVVDILEIILKNDFKPTKFLALEESKKMSIIHILTLTLQKDCFHDSNM